MSAVAGRGDDVGLGSGERGGWGALVVADTGGGAVAGAGGGGGEVGAGIGVGGGWVAAQPASQTTPDAKARRTNERRETVDITGRRIVGRMRHQRDRRLLRDAGVAPVA